MKKIMSYVGQFPKKIKVLLDFSCFPTYSDLVLLPGFLLQGTNTDGFIENIEWILAKSAKL